MPKGNPDPFGPTIAFRPLFVRITGSTHAALFLSQCLYWSDRHEDRGGWFYKTSGEWTEEIGLTRRQQDAARKELVASGFIEERRAGLKGVMNYRIIPEAITEAISVCTNTPNSKNVRIRQTEPSCLYDSAISVCTDQPFLNVRNSQTAYINTKTSSKTSSSRERATRLQPDWELPEEWRKWAENERPDVDVLLEARKFKNHWLSTTRNAAKLDWFRTWQNWILNARPSPKFKNNSTSQFKTLSEQADEYSEILRSIGHTTE